MTQSEVNFYEEIGNRYQMGLDFIIQSLPLDPVIDDLVKAVCIFIQPLYHPVKDEIEAKLIEIEIKNTARIAIAFFSNNLIEENENQNAALLGANIKKLAEKFWTGGHSSHKNYKWNRYLKGVAISDLIDSANDGTSAGFAANSTCMHMPANLNIPVEIVCGLIGALTITSGKAIFNWIPKHVKVTNLNFETLVNLLSFEPNKVNQPTVKNNDDLLLKELYQWDQSI